MLQVLVKGGRKVAYNHTIGSEKNAYIPGIVRAAINPTWGR